MGSIHMAQRVSRKANPFSVEAEEEEETLQELESPAIGLLAIN